MKKKLDELSLNNLAGKQIASLTTQRFSGERREIMGDAPKSTKLINSKVNYNEDTVTYFFLTEATEKYPPNYMYQDIVPQNNFSFEPDPSKTYEIILKFGYISRLKDNPNLTINDVKAFLWNTDVKIWSNSPSFHWQGFNYNLSQLDAALYPTNIAPQKWDKIHGEALIDKHLLDLFIHLKFFMNQMAGSLLNKIRAKRENIMTKKSNIKEVTAAVADPERQELWVEFGEQKNVGLLARVYLDSGYGNKPKDYKLGTPIFTVTQEQLNKVPESKIDDYVLQTLNSKILPLGPKRKNEIKFGFRKVIKYIKMAFSNPKKYSRILQIFDIRGDELDTVDLRVRATTTDAGQAGEVIKVNPDETGDKEDFQIKGYTESKEIPRMTELTWKKDGFGPYFLFSVGKEAFSAHFEEQSDRLNRELLHNIDNFDIIPHITQTHLKRFSKLYNTNSINETYFEFGDDTEGRRTGNPIGVTGKGNVPYVFKKVREGLLKYIEDYPNVNCISLEASAESKSRGKLYVNMLKRALGTHPGWNMIVAIYKNYSHTLIFILKDEIYNKVFSELAPKKNIKEAEETKKETLVCTFADFTPITRDHIELCNKVVSTAHKLKGDHSIFVKVDNDNSSKFVWDNTTKQLVKLLPNLNVCGEDTIYTINDVAEWAYNRKYTDLIVVVGNDKVEEYKRELLANNKKEIGDHSYDFDTIQVVSLGTKDPDTSELTQKTNNAIIDGNIEEVYSLLGYKNKDLMRWIYNTVRYKINNDIV